MVKFTWKDGYPESSLPIKQVYGIIFSSDGRILIICDRTGNNEKYSLIGGRPELTDHDIFDTLKREFSEEVNSTIKSGSMHILGYQLVEIEAENNVTRFAQMRVTGLLDKVGERKPDIDNGKEYERILVPPDIAIELLNWGEVGEKQIQCAVKVAKEKFCIENYSTEIEYI